LQSASVAAGGLSEQFSRDRMAHDLETVLHAALAMESGKLDRRLSPSTMDARFEIRPDRP
jgi:hypothetical protein